MDIYPSWCENKRRHNIRKEDEYWIFQKFWKIFAKITFDDIGQGAYNRKTMQGFMNLLTLRKEDEENEETGKVKQNMYMILNSLEYDEAPKYTSKGLESIIITIVKQCKGLEDNTIVIDEKNTEEGLLGNTDLLTYGYIIDQEELEKRFQRFWEWYSTIVPTKRVKSTTMEIFKGLLYLEERIVEENKKVIQFMKSIEYHERIDMSRILAEVITEFVDSEGFTLSEEAIALKRRINESGEENTESPGTSEEDNRDIACLESDEERDLRWENVWINRWNNGDRSREESDDEERTEVIGKGYEKWQDFIMKQFKGEDVNEKKQKGKQT